MVLNLTGGLGGGGLLGFVPSFGEEDDEDDFFQWLSVLGLRVRVDVFTFLALMSLVLSMSASLELGVEVSWGPAAGPDL